MSISVSSTAPLSPTPRKPIRLWPGVTAVLLQWLSMFGLPIVSPELGGIAVLAGMAGALLVLLWWLLLGRAAWTERLGALVLMALAVAITSRLIHPSISNGMMGFMVYIFSAPLLSLALVAWAAVSSRLPAGRRFAAMAAALVLGCATLTLVRTNGISGDAVSDLAWRWTPTAEERLLAQAAEDPVVPPSAPAEATPPATSAVPPTGQPAARPAAAAETAEDGGSPPAPIVEARHAAAAWPGFRGLHRDSVIHGVRIATDWSASPPVELWRRPIGPGWSSFAVAGDRFFTQEQRGDDEVVSAYSLKTGELVWRHRDAARFWESNAGAGPRATPTLGNGRVYTLGGTGILNALDARDGSVVWSRNAASDTGREVPDWGIASSPIVVADLVVAATNGVLVAYDAATGKPRWTGSTGGWGYSSPHLLTIDGIEQVVLLNGAGAIGVAPADGTVLWQYAWSGDGMVQPALVADGDFLIGSGSGLSANSGVRRVSVAHNPGGWNVNERWTSSGLKPYFNDFVIHAGHAFGFDGSILAAIDLADGKRKWKGGRYGHGQLVVLPDQDVLLVLSEEGELALVKAAPDQFTELARFKAIEGKTWNHPVLVGDVLLVRNGEEMAAFRLALR